MMSVHTKVLANVQTFAIGTYAILIDYYLQKELEVNAYTSTFDEVLPAAEMYASMIDVTCLEGEFDIWRTRWNQQLSEKKCREQCATCTRTLFKDYSTEHFHALADSSYPTSNNSRVT